MKQRITIEQLKDLTEEQKQKLREWWKPEPGDKAVIAEGTLNAGKEVLICSYDEEYDIAGWECEGGWGSYGKDNLEPLLSIGQMIELLNYYDCDIEIQSAGATWYVMVGGHINTDNDKLTDALWQAVKEVL
jgi:hypothetical protein